MSRFDSGPIEAGPVILVVDDDFDFRECFVCCLRDAGFRAVSAGGGAEALELLARGMRPSVIILDLMMPEMNGVEALAAIRANPNLERVPVIVSSASLRGEETILGATAMVRKPFDLDSMIDAVTRFCLDERTRDAG